MRFSVTINPLLLSEGASGCSSQHVSEPEAFYTYCCYITHSQANKERKEIDEKNKRGSLKGKGRMQERRFWKILKSWFREPVESKWRSC